MIIDIAEQIGATSREVTQQQTESGETVAVTLQRRYPAAQADVWEAITDPDRVRRWFLPITGELREGGNFHLEGNASGHIITCEAPRHLVVTFGHESSIVKEWVAAIEASEGADADAISAAGTRSVRPGSRPTRLTRVRSRSRPERGAHLRRPAVQTSRCEQAGGA